MVYGLKLGKYAIAILLISSILLASLASTSGAESQILILAENFDDYVVKTYSGTDGPGMWYQDVGGGGSATYSIVSSGGRTYYKLESIDGVFVKAILPYYLFFIYIGPVNYSVTTTMRIDKGEGGIIFRIQFVKIGSSYYLRKYYLATVYKDTGKVILWYVDETEGPGAGPKLAVANVPSGVNLDDWFTLNVVVKGNNIRVSVGGKEVINVYDDRLTYGSVGLYTYKGGSASFDQFSWVAYVPAATETITTTTTVTQTQAATVTTTIPATTITKTITATTTVSGATTITETVTQPVETITKTQTSTVARTITTTTTQRAIRTRTVTKTEVSTVTSTVTETKGLGCLIATAAFGSELAPQVQLLRNFRDNFVLRTFAGSNFMILFNAFYYSWSPYVAKAEYENPALRSFVRASIYPLIYSLELSRMIAQPLSTMPELAVLVTGIVASLLIGLIYVSPILLAIFLISRWRNRSLPSMRKRYILLALASGLLIFLMAELLSIAIVMMIASAIIVLSCIALGAILPTMAAGYLVSRES